MDARDFYNMFIEKTKEDNIYNGEKDIYGKDYPEIKGKTYLEIYKNGADYTNLVNKIIIPQIIKEAGYEPQNEYYRVDTVGWESNFKTIEKEANEAGLKPHLWNLKIAVEHENSLKDWTDEVIKLIHIRCPLKVLICYNHFDQRKNGNDEEKLNLVSEWMKRIEVFKECSEEKFMIIIGNARNLDKKSPVYSNFGYKGYLLDFSNKKFKAI